MAEQVDTGFAHGFQRMPARYTEVVLDADAPSGPRLSASTDVPGLLDTPEPTERAADAAKTATAPAADHDARIAEAERRLAAAQQPLPAAPAPTAPDPGPPPNRRDFDDPSEFDAALVRFGAQTAVHQTLIERQKQDTEKAAIDRQAAANQAIADLYALRKAQFSETHPDYAEVAEREDLQISTPMMMTIANMEAGPAVAYWLGQNKAEAARIAQIQQPAKVIYELGRIASRVEAGEPERQTRAAATPPARRGTPAPSVRAAREPDMNAYAAQRNEQLAKERRGGRMFG
jgi:hypothetical protein